MVLVFIHVNPWMYPEGAQEYNSLEVSTTPVHLCVQVQQKLYTCSTISDMCTLGVDF